ncbi:MAG: phosphate ABC transporter permease PstA [Nocardioides sp.]
MSTPTTTRPDAEERPRRQDLPLTHPTLPRIAPGLVGVMAVAAALLLGLPMGWGLGLIAVAAIVLFTVALPAWSRAVEGSRAATDRLVTSLVWSAFGIAMLPLVTLIYQVITKGAKMMTGQFFTYSMRNVIGEGGGIYHAIIGTLVITLFAAIISVPVGIMAAIYLVEYGGKSRMARAITFLVDVMTGIPSIVAGLFAYALFVIIFGPGVRMGFGGSIALSVLMIPIVVRSAEEMLKLVPDELREASYALGVPKWRTIMKVVLPTSLAGIVTGVMLAVARVAGETAPLLIIAGDTDSVNFNAFSERMATLPVFIYYSFTQPGVPPEFGQDRAWGAALVLIAIVMTLNFSARAISSLFSPKTGR